MTIIKDKISYKNSLKQRLTILNDRLEINRNKLSGLTSNLTNVSKSLQDNHLVNVSLTERRKAIELYREIEEIESEIIITSNHYNSLETEINQTITPLIEDNTTSINIDDRSEVTLDEVLSGQEISRVNGESAKSFRARLQRRLSGLMLIDKELQEELKLRMSDVERTKDELKDLEIQRLRLQLQLTNNKPPISNSTSNDFNSTPYKSSINRSDDMNELTVLREEKKLLQSAAKLLAEDLIDIRHTNSTNNVNRRLDKQLDTQLVKKSDNDIDRHITSNPVTPAVRSRETSRIPVSVSMRRSSSVDSSIGSPVTSGYSTRKKLGVLYGQIVSGSTNRHVDSLVISPGTESDRESVDRRVMTQLIDRLEDLSEHMDQHHAKSRLRSSSNNNDELVKSGSEYRDLLIAAIATQQEQIDILRSRLSDRPVSRYSSPIRSVSPRNRAMNSSTLTSSPTRSTSPIRSPKQSSNEFATSHNIVPQTARQLNTEVVEEIPSPSRSNMKSKASTVSVEERRRQYSEKLKLFEKEEKINAVTGIAVDSANGVSLGKLEVIVISARNLPAMKRLDKSSDPYVEISLVTANYLEGEESVIANAGDFRRRNNTNEDTTDTDSYNNDKNLTKHTTIKVII
mmetsp:Transcript_20272/g.18406  ORF Transcript_20272/g.18406 Transcript_20272/m.18406 type:complete len:627 (+) Transcript_20272:1-1881(+)